MSILFKRIIAFFIATVIILVVAFSTCNSCGSKSKSKEIPDEVYICNSVGGKNYHIKKKCEGLQRCKHEIIKISKDEALEKKLDKCDICVK